MRGSPCPNSKSSAHFSLSQGPRPSCSAYDLTADEQPPSVCDKSPLHQSFANEAKGPHSPPGRCGLPGLMPRERTGKWIKKNYIITSGSHRVFSTAETHWEKSRQDDQRFGGSFKVLLGRNVCSYFTDVFVADKIVL